MEKKMATSVESLCKGYPPAFVTYLKYTKNLKFEDRPDYNFLRRTFKELFFKCGYEHDFIFDWCVQEPPAPLKSSKTGSPPPNLKGKSAGQKGQRITPRENKEFMLKKR